MRYIIRLEGRYATGRTRYRRTWTDDIDKARVFERIVDAKNSAFWRVDTGVLPGSRPEIVAVELKVMGVAA